MFFLQRALNTLYSDDIFIEPQPKQPRLIILPQDEGQREDSSGEELEILGAASVSTETSSRRMLEAAGNHIATDISGTYCMCTWLRITMEGGVQIWLWYVEQ